MHDTTLQAGPLFLSCLCLRLQVARRITLQRLMPDAAKTFSLLFTKLEIQEPCFTDLVILYRKSKKVLDRPSSEKDPLPSFSKVDTVCQTSKAG